MSREEMTTKMVKNIQFGKIVKPAGQNKRAGRKYFSDLLKFIYSEKATKILRNLPLTFDQ